MSPLDVVLDTLRQVALAAGLVSFGFVLGAWWHASRYEPDATSMAAAVGRPSPSTSAPRHLPTALFPPLYDWATRPDWELV